MDNPKAYEIDGFFHNNTASFRNSLFKCFVSRYGVGLKTQTKLKSYDSYRVADEDRDAGGMAHWKKNPLILDKGEFAPASRWHA